MPRMHMPTVKHSRARALVAHLLADRTHRCSRLALATVARTLQSVVPKTPGQIGSTCLIHTCNCIHEGMDPNAIGTRSACCSPVAITPECWAELEWWQEALGPGACHQEQVRDCSLTGIMVGDGSGTGAGGSLSFHHPHDDPGPGTETWMGTWISSQAKTQSSNWRELRTLVEFLRREVRKKTPRFRHRRVFCFTDNSATCDVCRTGKSGSPGLHRLVTELKSLEMRLQCVLIAVHLPGDQIIAQGSDGLSRGLWLPGGHEGPNWSLAPLFEPVGGSIESLTWLLELAGRVGRMPDEVQLFPQDPADWHLIRDPDSWRAQSLINKHCLWLVSPSLARQAFAAAAQAWCENPLANAHFFVVPRVLQRSCGRVNKHTDCLGQFDSPDTPFSHPLPVVVFFLPVHRRRLADLTRGVDSPPGSWEPGWVSRQLKHMCGLWDALRTPFDMDLLVLGIWFLRRRPSPRAMLHPVPCRVRPGGATFLLEASRRDKGLGFQSRVRGLPIRVRVLHRQGHRAARAKRHSPGHAAAHVGADVDGGLFQRVGAGDFAKCGGEPAHTSSLHDKAPDALELAQCIRAHPSHPPRALGGSPMDNGMVRVAAVLQQIRRADPLQHGLTPAIRFAWPASLGRDPHARRNCFPGQRPAPPPASCQRQRVPDCPACNLRNGTAFGN